MDCGVSECADDVHAKGWCRRHYLRAVRHGDPTAGGPYRPNRTRKVGRDGDTRRTSNGYVLVRTAGQWLLQHRVVMAQALGRDLLPGENVHHLDGDKTNNEFKNLELWTRPQPTGVRARDLEAAT